MLMSAFMFVIWVAGCAAFMCVVAAPGRTGAILTRPFHHRLFPLANKIAESMRTDRGSWAFDVQRRTATHGPSKLEVDVGYGGGQIRLRTAIGYWSPNLIEQAIISGAFNTLVREEARLAAEHGMHPADAGPRPLLAHEQPDPHPGQRG